MARARLLKPSFFTNDDLAKLPPLTRLLFAGLWCIADREGRLEDRPERIRAEVLPYDKVNLPRMLNELADYGFIQRYEADGCKYIQIRTFKKHQSPHVREPASTIPAPAGTPATTGLASVEHGASTVLAPDKHSARPGISGTGPAVAVIDPVAVTVADHDPVAEAVGDDDDDGLDAGFRDRYGTLIASFGGQISQRMADEYTQIANEWTLEEIERRTAAVKRQGKRPYPSELWKAAEAERPAPPSKQAWRIPDFDEVIRPREASNG
jgi:hypothetical protein